MIDIPLQILLNALAAVIVMLIHEGAKHYYALVLMHPIYREREDKRFYPKRYIDPIGLIFFTFGSIGWQKPGEFSPARFKDKERSLLSLSIIGLVSNILVMLALIPLYRWLYVPTSMNAFVQGYLIYFVGRLIYFNFALVIINLLPIPPMDMSKIIYALNPSFYFRMIQNERIIHAVFILLIAFNIIYLFVNSIFGPVMQVFGI